MEQWKITRDRQKCTKPGCPLATARSYYAVLTLPDCLRQDLCESCFTEEARQCEKPPIFWRAVRRTGKSKGPVLDLASLRVLFDRLGEEEGERAIALRYFTALLLLRKRMLKMTDPRTRKQEQADLLVIDPKVKDMEPVALFAPELDLDDLGAVKDELLAAIGEGDPRREGAEDSAGAVAEADDGPATSPSR